MDNYKLVVDGTKIVGMWNSSQYEKKMCKAKHQGLSLAEEKEIEDMEEELGPLEILEEVEDDNFYYSTKKGYRVVSNRVGILMRICLDILRDFLVKIFFIIFGKLEKVEERGIEQ